MAVKQLAVDLLRIDGGTQLREKIDQATVDDYREGWVNEVKFPPLVVFFDGTDNWLADGFHRYHGASAACLPTVPCDVRNGTLRDAILFAAGANQENGLRRTNEDKRKAVRTLLEDSEWCKRSDRWIAEAVGVDHVMVSRLRGQLVLSTSSTESGEPEERVGRDGKTRAVPKKKPKAKPAEPAEPVAVKNGKPSGGNTFNPAEWDGEPVNDPEKPTEILDGEKNPVPPKFREIFGRASELTDLERQLQSVVKKLEDSQADPLYSFVQIQGTVVDINNAKRAIRFAKPFVVCPYCKGKTCKACKGQGWVNKPLLKQAPVEMRP